MRTSEREAWVVEYEMNSVYSHTLAVHECEEEAREAAEAWRNGDREPSDWMEERMVEALERGEDVVRVRAVQFEGKRRG